MKSCLNTRLKSGTIQRIVLVTICCIVLPLYFHAQVEITLKSSFIEAYKNRATIDTQYTVDKAHARPNPASQDGDMHIAGRCPEAGLPSVAEIMNAASEKKWVDRIHEVEGSGQPVSISGVWRIWCEHAGSYEQVQGNHLDPFSTTNPAHVFEIHPVTQIDGQSLAESLRWIPGYTPKNAEAAFARYEAMPCKIVPNADDTTTIITKGVGFNYVKFKLEVPATKKEAEDGWFIFSPAMDMNGEVLVQNLRMVFVKGSPPEAELLRLKAGDSMTVLGIPRIDLALVSYRTAHAGVKPYVLEWNLPYEIVIVGLSENSTAP